MTSRFGRFLAKGATVFGASAVFVVGSYAKYSIYTAVVAVLLQGIAAVSDTHRPEPPVPAAMSRSELALELAEAVGFDRPSGDAMEKLDPVYVEILVDVAMKTGERLSLRAVSEDGRLVTPVVSVEPGRADVAGSRRIADEIVAMAKVMGTRVECVPIPEGRACGFEDDQDPFSAPGPAI